MRALVSTEDASVTLPADEHTEVGALIAGVRLAIITGLDEEFLADTEVAALEVTAAQFVILKHVYKGSAQSACDLCKTMDYDRGAMSRMIDRLEAKRLIRRVALAHTRRSVALEVTEAGKAAFPLMEACADRVVNRLLTGVTTAQVKEFEKVLRRMLANA